MDWILAEERLPDEREVVLVYTEHVMYGKEKYVVRDITVGEYDYFSNKWKCCMYLGNRVIAWKPLPEPPRGL